MARANSVNGKTATHSSPAQSVTKNAPNDSARENVAKVTTAAKTTPAVPNAKSAKTAKTTKTTKTAKTTAPAPKSVKGKTAVAKGKGSKLEVPGSMASPLRIFQIYYEAWQRDLLDPSFATIDNSQLKSELEEFLILERLAKSDYVKGAKLWGALSWRFAERTGMKSADWVAAIQADRGKDVYYCDPAPLNEALFHNLWMQGEMAHPNFLAVCAAFFKATKLPTEMMSASCPGSNTRAPIILWARPSFGVCTCRGLRGF